ncbi:hypothetical protein K435DRAFT_741185 [Dendrothele bispora CBS 962.96]|uniref:F-box domain-containing protein n=1 Tax=Dendrothele bispora (strain CBS 962.96) TaxID=1314807 RepID=A0A4S8MWV2_DENBC|nr:hypothetical protein K435DRAFT_741185 [Dendrothele bispora CBS 962.96]
MNSSTSYALADSSNPTATIFTLPPEVLDQIICSCALYGFPEAIGALSWTCQYFRNHIYGQDSSDANTSGGNGGYLWREIFLTTFDDPRHYLKAAKRPLCLPEDGAISFDWRLQFQRRTQAGSLFRSRKVPGKNYALEPTRLTRSLEAITSTIATSLPLFPADENPDGSDRVSKSSSLAWLNQLLCDGYSVPLTHKLLGSSPVRYVYIGVGEETGKKPHHYERKILKDKWNLSDAGQAFFKLVIQAGFRPLSSPSAFDFTESKESMVVDTNEAGPSQASSSSVAVDVNAGGGGGGGGEGSPSKPSDASPDDPDSGSLYVPLPPERQRKLARLMARRRVYNLSFLSRNRLWGPFLPYLEDANQPVKAKDKTKTKGMEERKGKGKVVDDGDGRPSTKRSSDNSSDSDQDNSAHGDYQRIINGSSDAADNVEGPSSTVLTTTTAVPYEIMRAIVTQFGVYIQGPDFLEAVHQAHEEDDDPAEGEPEGGGGEGEEEGTRHNLVFNLLDLFDHEHNEDDEDDEDFQPQDGDEDDDMISADESDPGEDNTNEDATFFSPRRTKPKYPMYPPLPHLVRPDYAFLAAARIIVEENLKDRLEEAEADVERLRDGGNNRGMTPGWPWFTSMAAIEGTRDLLDRIRVGLPNNSSTEAEDNKKKNGASCSNDEQGDGGLESMRMGTMPGFWDGWNQFPPHTETESDHSIDSEVTGSDDPKDKGKGKARENGTDGDNVDGWDWAGICGVWLRAVCWMDYRDLLFHNFRINHPNMVGATGRRYSNPEEIQETCRVFAITLRVIGYERVSAPLALPSTSASRNNGKDDESEHQGSASSGKGKGKGKEKATEEESNGAADYNPLVYLLPVIHFAGEFRGSDVDTHAHRRARGTVRMIGDGAVRWTMISSDASAPERDEWTMEGVQIGGVGSQFGVIGLWTGARHEEGDPIGPTWAWKVT